MTNEPEWMEKFNERIPWQIRFEKLYRSINGLPDDDPLLKGHCQIYIKAIEVLIQEEVPYHIRKTVEEEKEKSYKIGYKDGHEDTEKIWKALLPDRIEVKKQAKSELLSKIKEEVKGMKCRCMCDANDRLDRVLLSLSKYKTL